MSQALGHILLDSLAGALQPITLHAATFLGPDWVNTPGFTLFFITVFIIAFSWIRYAGVDPKKAPFIASCAMSSVHAALCITAGFTELYNWGHLRLDTRNTPLQSLQLQYSFAYLLADTLYFLTFDPSDLLFLAHHALAGGYLFATLYLRVGGISGIFVFFLGEVTSPLFNIFNVAKELKHDHAHAARVLEFISPVFTFSFVLVRSVISPVLIGWFIYTLWFQSPGIPVLWRVGMGLMVAIGLAGSQVWSYKLIQGWRKARQAKRRKVKTG